MSLNLPILIAGLPRSGTTWVGSILSATKTTLYFFEPDNEKISPLAWLYKKNNHRFPYLTGTDEADLYEQMWYIILNGSVWIQYINQLSRLLFRNQASSLEASIGEKTGFRYCDESFRTVHANRSPYSVDSHPLVASLIRLLLAMGRGGNQQKKRLIVKSVHTPLCLEWLTSRFSVLVALVLRNPYSLYASYKRLKMPDGYRNPLFQSTLQRDLRLYISESSLLRVGSYEDYIAFQIMLFYKVMETQLARHPEWVVISHDRLCINPYDRFKDVFAQLGLTWTDDIVLKIEAHNKQGSGFVPARITKLQPFKWRDELTQDEQNTVNKWINDFELTNFLKEYVYLSE